MHVQSGLRYLAIRHAVDTAYAFDAFAAPNPNLLPAFLWKDRDGGDIWLGLGWAGVFPMLADCRAALAQIDYMGSAGDFSARCFGVIGFDPEADLVGLWCRFQSRLYVLPEVVVRFHDDGAEFLLIRPVLDAISAEEAEIECRCRVAEVRLALENRQDRAHRVVTGSGEFTSRAQWNDAVAAIKRAIASGDISKVVLARSEWREAATPWNPALILERLALENKGGYLFGHRLSGDAFIGASPERLFALNGNQLRCDSLAGTRSRGTTEIEDARLAAELLSSGKDQREQQIVTDELCLRIAALADGSLAIAEPVIRKQKHVQHLWTEIGGNLKNDSSIDDLIAALHPTPAICGFPREQAAAMITALESVPRGLYAGAIGWLDSARAEFAVSIRSALLSEEQAVVFAGAGIVKDSDPDNEWDETTWKMQPLLRALEG